MKMIRIAAVLMAASLAASASLAQVSFDVPDNLAMPTSTLTRAEVVADSLVYRASGLHDLTDRGEADVDTNSLPYKQAEARYAHLRSSTQFAALVEQIQRGGSRQIVIAQRR